jgi:hypothetical protein
MRETATMFIRLAALLAAAAPAFAQTPPAAEEPAEESRPFRLGGEAKLHYRDSVAIEVRNAFPFPPDFIPPGQTEVFLRTPHAGSSLEFSNVSLIGEGDLTPGVAAKVEVHFLDLYNRNPTSSDDRVFVREAWVRLGRKYEALEGEPRTSFYVLAGMAPRYSKQILRRLESYGLWGTAVGRFEEPQVQIGGALGRSFYWRASVASGNPLFFRDTNALAGDNGTPERQPGRIRPAVFESGFPILYDAKATEINFSGQFQWGAGLGLRFGSREGEKPRGLDLLGWYFKREMADRVPLRGTTYSGDLKLLQGVAFPLPFSGRDKIDRGLNLDARLGPLSVFGQYVDQDIAKLKRRGFETELAFRIPLDGLFLVGESPVGTWLVPVFRFSRIDNLFEAPRQHPAPSVDWDWNKYDIGLRFGVVRDVDLTVEFSRHDMFVGPARSRRNLHPDETLVTLRVGF